MKLTRRLAAHGAVALLAGAGLLASSLVSGANAADNKDEKLLQNWIKTCAGKEKRLCETRRDVLDTVAGEIYAPIALVEIFEKDKKKKTLLRMTLPYYMARLVPKDPKAKPEKGKKVEMILIRGFAQWRVGSGFKLQIDKDKKPLVFPVSVCHRVGCMAITEVKPDLLKRLKSAKRLLLAGNSGGQPLMIPISMKGFKETLEGKPIDVKTYKAAWDRYIKAENKRIAELRKKLQEEAAKKKK